MLGKNRISTIQKLHQKKFRMQENLFIAEGAKIVPEILRSSFGVSQVIATQTWIEKNQDLLQNQVVEVALPQDLEKISTLSTAPEVLAICNIPEETVPEYSPGSFVLLLDAIRDPGNLGTIIRLADWFGVSAIIASSDCVEWTNPKVIQATMGSFIRIRPQYTDLQAYIEGLPKGCAVRAADLEGENLYTANYSPNGCLILSSESHGLSAYLESLVNGKLHIPRGMDSTGQTESLNVATAAAIFLGEFIRRRSFSSH